MIRAVAVLAVLVAALAAPGSASVDRGGGAARAPYPPARLWYRVSVEFKGAVQPVDTAGQPDARTGNTALIYAARVSASWTLRSNTAVRLTLNCVDTHDPDAQPFLATARIRGRQTPIGGCPSGSREGLSPTLRFAANANGEVGSWMWNRVFRGMHCAQLPAALKELGSGFCPAVEPASIVSCTPWPWRIALTSSQRLSAQISTPSSLSEGLVLAVQAISPFGTVHSAHDPSRCRHANGTVVRIPGHVIDREFVSFPLLGDDASIAYDGNWTALRNLLRFNFPAGRFGKSFDVTRNASQPALRGRQPPSGVGVWEASAAKQYRYTIRFDPCPGGGRDVKRC